MSTSSSKVCRHCRATELRRINRKGYLQRVVLPKLGLYPWECVLCRHRFFMRDDGHRPSSRSANTKA